MGKTKLLESIVLISSELGSDLHKMASIIVYRTYAAVSSALGLRAHCPAGRSTGGSSTNLPESTNSANSVDFIHT